MKQFISIIALAALVSCGGSTTTETTTNSTVVKADTIKVDTVKVIK